MTKHPPNVRPDGKCVVCLKPRHPEWSKKYAGDAVENDPFCSASCARRYFGCELSGSRGIVDEEMVGA